jgi:uncharacterized repeat protein (TIGR02543 family)
VTSIEYEAFHGCSGLTSVTSLIENPFKIDGKKTFDLDTYNNATLYVPKGAIEKYKSTEGWKSFVNILPLVKNYNLSYMVDGEVYQSVSVEEGEAITPIEEPTKEGYTFSGWSGLPETMPGEDVVVTGTFSVNKYKVTYMVDGAEYKTTEVEYGSTLTAEAEPTKEGYSFSGWSGLPATMPANDVIVTGTFTVNKYTITYVVDGVTIKTEEVEYGTTITPPTSQKDGYEISWNAHPTTMPAYGITIYGRYISTGIENYSREAITDNRYFNLNGQRIEGQPSQKGVYIKNGKKVLMK